MGNILITPPALEPLTLAEAKAHLRLDASDEDALVNSLITVARQMVEAHTGRALIAQGWRIVLDAWPNDNTLALPPGPFISFGAGPNPNTFVLPLGPFISLDAIRVYDAFNVATPLAAGTWYVDAQPGRARLQFTTAPPQPGRAIAGIEIDVTVGYGPAAGNVPEALRLVMRMLVARWFETRGDAPADTGQAQIPTHIEALLQPYRVLRLA